MLVRKTKMPSNCASASTFAGSNGEAPPFRSGEEPAVTSVGHQFLVALRQLAVQISEQFRPGLGVLARLFLVTTDDVAAAGERDVFHRQLGFALLAWDD